MSRHCKDCEHWTKRYWIIGHDLHGTDWGYCSIVGLLNRRQAEKELTLIAKIVFKLSDVDPSPRGPVAAELITMPDFGCEMFEQKPAPENYRK
jgi:hypothetical protein